MGHHSGYSSGVLSPLAQNAATSIRDSREREKKEISGLKDKLAGYIEKVRFLEAQNRKIQTNLELLSGKRGKDTHNIRHIYESELID
jgi:intermediate filament protein if